jgi:putative NIF3 family GTP cyclohydrolase 1 type 2
MGNLSRRTFAQVAGLGLAAGQLVNPSQVFAQGRLTAGEVVQRILKNQGVPPVTTSFRDTFKIGNPDMIVTGISTSFGGNLSVLQKSLKAGLNMLITHEPTFWTDGDVIGRVQDDPLYRYKLEWAQKNNMIVWRDHDDIHSMKPDLIFVGWAKAMGWDAYSTDPVRNGAYTIPATTLNDLAKYVMARLKLRSVRVIGDPNLRVSKAVLGRGMNLPDDADVKIASDIREWDAFEYARDAVYAGRKKGLIDISHEAYEDTGMQAFASFLRPLVPEVPVQYISTECVFWSV